MLPVPTATKFLQTFPWTFLAGLGPALPCCAAAVPAFQEGTPAVEGQAKLGRERDTVFWSVKCELQDKAGNLWFGTGGEGLYRFDGTSFTNFTTEDGLPEDGVNAILEDRHGRIVVGTGRGIVGFDGERFSRYGGDVLPDTLQATCLLEDDEGNLWIGTLTNGVYRYDGKTLTNHLGESEGPFHLGRPYQTILDILQDEHGNLWFSSWNGGGAWRHDGRSFENFVPSADYYQRNEDGRSADKPPAPAGPERPDPLPPQASIADDMIFSIAQDRAGNIWFATRNHGACRYDGTTFTTLLGKECVYSVLEDRQGHMWFTTESHGVWRYDGKTFENFTTQDGLVHDSVFSVLEDRDGNLWFGTRDGGLSRYDGKTFTTFSQ